MCFAQTANMSQLCLGPRPRISRRYFHFSGKLHSRFWCTLAFGPRPRLKSTHIGSLQGGLLGGQGADTPLPPGKNQSNKNIRQKLSNCIRCASANISLNQQCVLEHYETNSLDSSEDLLTFGFTHESCCVARVAISIGTNAACDSPN